jgi:hypothetical protein
MASNSDELFNSSDTPSSLTKRQAYEEMKKGNKVSHKNFIDEEYLILVKGNVFSEEDILICSEEKFFLYNKGVDWQTGWSLYQ